MKAPELPTNPRSPEPEAARAALAALEDSLSYFDYTPRPVHDAPAYTAPLAA